VAPRGARRLVGGLVVEGEGAQELSGGAVDDLDVRCWTSTERWIRGVGSADTDVEKTTGGTPPMSINGDGLGGWGRRRQLGISGVALWSGVGPVSR
jgi:hypothetical protein